MTAQIGDFLIAKQVAQKVADPTQPPTRLPGDTGAQSILGILADISERLARAERMTKIQVSGDNVLAAITLSPEDVLITGDRISLIGEVTFADWHRDVSGQITGGIEPSITTIRGGVIRTQKILSFDSLSYMDLDATGSNPFIQLKTSGSLNADGTFSLGGTTGKKLVWDGSDLTIQGGALLGSTSVSTVVTGAANGTTALSSKLNKSASDILSGTISFNSAGGFATGTISVDSAGNATGSGVAITQKGIVGLASSVATFTLDATTGAATFSGALSAASGSFAGNVTSTGYVHVTGGTSNGIFNAGISSIPSNTAYMGIYAASTTGIGMQGVSNSSAGMKGVSVSGAGGFFQSTSAQGVWGSSSTGVGVRGSSTSNTGVEAVSSAGLGYAAMTADGSSGASGIHATSDSGVAGWFTGNTTRGSLYLDGPNSKPSNKDAYQLTFISGYLCYTDGTDWRRVYDNAIV